VFYVSDQHCPASITSGDDLEKECTKVVRVEKAAFQEMTSVLLDIMEGFFIPLGTVVLLSGLAHLGHVGVQAFAEDPHLVSKRLYERYGSGEKLVHGLTTPGSNLDSASIRAWHDLDTGRKIGSPQIRLEKTAEVLLGLLKVTPKSE